MNRRKFFTALFGSLAALPFVPRPLKQEKPKVYWAGTTISRDTPLNDLPLSVQLVVQGVVNAHLDKLSLNSDGHFLRPTNHPFQNNGASSGCCIVCGDAIIAHREILMPVIYPHPQQRTGNSLFRKIPAWAGWA
jgi:hypothetical protein